MIDAALPGAALGVRTTRTGGAGAGTAAGVGPALRVESTSGALPGKAGPALGTVGVAGAAGHHRDPGGGGCTVMIGASQSAAVCRRAALSGGAGPAAADIAGAALGCGAAGGTAVALGAEAGAALEVGPTLAVAGASPTPGRPTDLTGEAELRRPFRNESPVRGVARDRRALLRFLAPGGQENEEQYR